MVEEEVVKYLKEGRTRGFSFSILKNKLLESGFDKRGVLEAIGLIRQKEKKTLKTSKNVKLKKKNVGKSTKNNVSILSNAIKDLDAELKRLKREKFWLHNQLKEVSSSIGIDHEKEQELQAKITDLIEKEARLNEKKKYLMAKIESISDKIIKISKIKSEMGDIN